MPHCYLVDASIYVFRAWHVAPDSLVNQDGKPINALLGFSDFLYEFLHHTRADSIAIAFDESLGQCVRRQIYPEYKANRPPAPESLKYQFQQCRQLVRLLGITELADGAYEADDIIGALGKRAHHEGQTVHIITGDKDLTQLIHEGDSWWDYYRNRRWGVREIKKQWGVMPEQIADLLAIAGDKVDNIPGIPGVGTATAAKLLNRFGNLDSLLENQSQIHTMKTRGAARLQGLVEEHQETVQLARQLTGIFVDMPLETNISTQRTSPDEAELAAFFSYHGFGKTRTERWFELISG